MAPACLPAAAGGELYYDEGKAFYAAVHGGKVKKGSLLALLNPLGEAWKNMKRAKGSGLVEESNMNGDGLTLGGGRRGGGCQAAGMPAMAWSAGVARGRRIQGCAEPAPHHSCAGVHPALTSSKCARQRRPPRDWVLLVGTRSLCGDVWTPLPAPRLLQAS